MKNTFLLRKSHSGQSLVEVVISIGIVTLILIGLISAITYGLSNAQFARNKTVATKYAQEALEWFRSQRNAGWSSFYARGSAGAGTRYCFQTMTAWPGSGACNTSQVIDDQFDLFRREAILIQNGTDRMRIVVTVMWQQGSRSSDVVLDTYLTQWR